MLKCVTLSFVSVTLAAAMVLPARADEDPITLSVRTDGNFSKGKSWHLSVNSAGQAELTIDTFPKKIRKQFQVAKEQWAEFRKALADGKFFELRGAYGDLVPDGSERSVTVTAGRETHTVKVHLLRDSTPAQKAKLREASGVLRLLVIVRGWFEEAEAADHRSFDGANLEVAKE